MKKWTALFEMVCILLLASCGVQATPAALPSPTPAQTSTPVATISPVSPTAETTATATPTSTPTDTPAPTDTPLPVTETAIAAEAHLKELCLELQPELPAEVKSTGKLVLKSQISDEQGVLVNFDRFLMDMTTGEAVQIAKPGEKQFEYQVSPDRTRLAFWSEPENGDEADLVIMDANGQRLKTLPWSEGRERLAGWLDNERLVLNIADRDPDENQALKAATLLALNPFTGEQQVLPPDFPEIYDYSPVYIWRKWSITTYDPTLTRVAYLDQNFNLVLWDLQNQQALLTLENSNLDIPLWSPDGSRLVTGISVQLADELWGDELVLIDREGNVEQLTNLNVLHRTFLGFFSWSPDGRYLAGWMAPEEIAETSEAELIVIDTVTRRLQNIVSPFVMAGRDTAVFHNRRYGRRMASNWLYMTGMDGITAGRSW